MKRYKLYKKVKPLSYDLEALLSYIILPLIIVSYISYPVLYFLGFKAFVVFNIMVSGIATFYYRKSKKVITIVRQDTEDTESGVFLVAFVCFIIILIVLSVGNFGFYLLVLYQKTNQFNSYHFYSWLFILFGLPLLYCCQRLICYHYIRSFQNIQFFPIILDINYDLKLFITLDNIQFVNTVNRNSSNIKIKNAIKQYSQKEFLSKKTKTRQYYTNTENFRELVQIPINTDLILLSWFSHTENKYYSLEIPFPFQEPCMEKVDFLANNSKAAVKQTTTIQFYFYQNGGVKLFDQDMLLIDRPYNEERAVSEEYKRLNFLTND